MSLCHFQQTKKEKEITMKPSTKTLFALGCAYVITTASSFAQLVYTFDEYGNSCGPGPFHRECCNPILREHWIARPRPGLQSTIPVDNRRCGADRTGEPGRAQGDSDVVRFWNPTGGRPTQIIFYSDMDDAVLAPADTGLPTAIMPNT